MKTLTVQKIGYKNFKGLSEFVLEPNGNTAVFGDNGTGKTTLFDGVTWLFFGKDSQGRGDGQIKPRDKDGNEIHHLETEIDGIFDINGKIIVLKKRLYENYTKKRGTATESFQGNKNKFWIDGVPVKKKEFDSKIAEILDMNAFKLVTNPMEFNLLHWNARRNILLEICGDVSDQDVIDSDKNLESLKLILGDCSVDDHKKKIQEKKRDINKELTEIPARISENLEVVKNSVKPDQKIKDNLDIHLAEEKEKLRLLVSNEALSAKQTRLNEVIGEIQTANNESGLKQAKLKKPLLDAIDLLESDRRITVNKKKDLEDEISRDVKRNGISEEAIQKIGKKWFEEDAKKQSGDNSCPSCGQTLPEAQIEDVKKSFNKMKAVNLERIEHEGATLKEAIKARNESIEKAKISIDSATKLIEVFDRQTAVKQADLEKINEPVNTDDLNKGKEILESEIDALKNGSKIQEDTAKRHITEIQVKIDEWAETEASWKAAAKTRKRISELEAREKELAKEFENLESELFLVEQFIVKKVGMLEGQINSKFKLARFKMFNKQINGGIDECCETIFDGVSFNHGLNSAAQINVGLDIINTLSEYFGFKAPVFIDNAESVNEIIPMDCQVINLVVSRDKELTVSQTEARKAS